MIIIIIIVLTNVYFARKAWVSKKNQAGRDYLIMKIEAKRKKKLLDVLN